MIQFIVLSILSIKGFGPKYLFRSSEIILQVSQECTTVREAITKIFEQTKRIHKVPLEDIEKGISLAESILSNCQKYGIQPVTFLEEEYPENIKEVSELWPVLYLIGNKQLLHNYCVGIIGTQNPDNHGQIISQKLAEFTDEEEITLSFLNQKGVSSIVKETKDSFTIEVVSSGIDQVYLPSNEIFHSNLKCVISPFPPETVFDEYKFIEASKLLGSISNRVILVQDSPSDDTRFVISYFSRTERVLGIIQPIASAQKYPINSGNLLLIQEKKEGVIQYCRAKDVNEKSVHCSLTFITSKNDYPQFFKEEELPF